MSDERLVSEMKQVDAVVLRAGAAFLAVDAHAVVEVVIRGPVTRVPYGPPHLLGLTLVAGRLLQVFSLRSLLKLPDGAPALTLPRLMVLRADDQEVAFACEEASGVHPLSYRHQPIAAPPHGGTVEEEEEANNAWVTQGLATWEDTPVRLLRVPELVAMATAYTLESAA